jgi:hypothetical protein
VTGGACRGYRSVHLARCLVRREGGPCELLEESRHPAQPYRERLHDDHTTTALALRAQPAKATRTWLGGQISSYSSRIRTPRSSSRAPTVLLVVPSFAPTLASDHPAPYSRTASSCWCRLVLTVHRSMPNCSPSSYTVAPLCATIYGVWP